MSEVLVVDKDSGVAEVLAGILADEGHLVRLAANRGEALRNLAESVPDAVFLDFKAPAPDGAGLLRAMQAEPAWAAIPVIIMSALPEEAVSAQAGGYAAFLRKPFRAASVRAALQRAFRRR